MDCDTADLGCCTSGGGRNQHLVELVLHAEDVLQGIYDARFPRATFSPYILEVLLCWLHRIRIGVFVQKLTWQKNRHHLEFIEVPRHSYPIGHVRVGRKRPDFQFNGSTGSNHRSTANRARWYHSCIRRRWRMGLILVLAFDGTDDFGVYRLLTLPSSTNICFGE